MTAKPKASTQKVEDERKTFSEGLTWLKAMIDKTRGIDQRNKIRGQ